MPISTVAQVTDYLVDLFHHSFWKESAESVCEDEEDIQGKIVIVTGCSTGIGKSIALQLAKRGAKVLMGVRNLEKGETAKNDIKKLAAKEVDIELMKLDLCDFQSIRDFVQEFESKYSHLNILVNNAGFMDTNGVFTKTKDGFEQHIGTNHLGPFLLTRLLINALKKGAPSRIVCVSSSNLAIVPLDLEDLTRENVKTGDYGKEQYSISKLLGAVCMGKMASELEKNSGIMLLQLCPGYVKSDIFRNENGWFKAIRNSISLNFVGLTTHQGSETAVFCCVSKSLLQPSNAGKGEIYRFKKIWEKGNSVLMELIVSPDGETLYKMSEKLVGLEESKI